jgi:hypothetical protein
VCLFEKTVRNEWATRKEEREKAAEEEEADSRLAKARKVIVVFVLDFLIVLEGERDHKRIRKEGQSAGLLVV